MKKILLATSNPGKIRDYIALANNFPIELIPQSEYHIPDAPETGLTFVENALLKARNAASYTSLPTLGDDSGLVVDALNGAPGLYSARFAGENASASDNIQKLLLALKEIPGASRRARLLTVCVLLRTPNDPAPIISQGVWEGEILEAPRGEGFGYLPIFYLPEFGCTAAELPQETKNKIGHRSQAFHQLMSHFLLPSSSQT